MIAFLAQECTDHEKRLELYEEVLSTCRDISQLIRKSDKIDNVELMTDYFTYLRIKNTVDRFLAMAQQVFNCNLSFVISFNKMYLGFPPHSSLKICKRFL